MTPEQIVLVRETTVELVRGSSTAMHQFYGRLFELDGSLRPMFSGDLTEQRAKFLATVVAVADSLHDLDALAAACTALGTRHRGYGVEARHYDVVREALLHAFSSSLGDGFTPDHRAAWISAYSLITELMQQAPPPSG